MKPYIDLFNIGIALIQLTIEGDKLLAANNIVVQVIHLPGQRIQGANDAPLRVRSCRLAARCWIGRGWTPIIGGAGQR